MDSVLLIFVLLVLLTAEGVRTEEEVFCVGGGVDTFSFSTPTIDCGAAVPPPKEVKNGLGLDSSVFLGGK